MPWFHKGPLKGWRAMTVNARAESVATSPAFGDAFAKRRCLVPADSWVEWIGAGKPKPKFFVQRRDGAPIMFAGLWDRCRAASRAGMRSMLVDGLIKAEAGETTVEEVLRVTREG